MEKIVFRNEFKRCLSKRLPVSNSYEWSRRIEGALVSSGEVAAFKEIMFLIDSELDYEIVKIILEEICQNLRMNSIFRRSKLSIIFWQDKGYEKQVLLFVSLFYNNC